MGPGPETTSSLTEQSAAAAANPAYGEHGVSTIMKPKAKGNDFKHRVASASDVTGTFPIKQTGANPKHYTVILPNPVTDETTQWFNNLFKPITPNK